MASRTLRGDDKSVLIHEPEAPPLLTPPHVPSPSQREAIEADAAPLLVLAGPGAGETFCLIERIRYLIAGLGLPPERLCAFTFTKKAAREIARRLPRAVWRPCARAQTGTLYAFFPRLPL